MKLEIRNWKLDFLLKHRSVFRKPDGAKYKPWFHYGLRHGMLSILIFLGVIGIFLIVQDFGITWDENVQSMYGEFVRNYYRSGFTDITCNRFLNLRYYGPSFEFACALLYQNFLNFKFEIRHFCIALTGLFTVVSLIQFARLIDKPLVAFFSAMSLVMLPRFFGHAFNNSKDIPFACLFAWSMWALVKLYTTKRFKLMDAVYCGILIGLTMSIRIGGILLLCFYGLVSLFAFFYFPADNDKLNPTRKLYQFLLISFTVIGSSWIVMVSLWPWAHGNMIMNPFFALKQTMQFEFTHTTLFEGKFFESNQLPWYYLPKYLAITTPPTVLVTVILGMVLSLSLLYKNFRDRKSLPFFVINLWFFFPFTYFVFNIPNVYDGMRHFLFLTPAMALYSGIGANWIYQTLRTSLNPRALICAITVLLALPLKDLITLHPYQTTYFNGFTGGMATAYKNYETDYWLSSYKEAAEWINGQGLPAGKEKVTVLLAANKHSRLCADHYFNDFIESEIIFQTGIPGQLPTKYDYYLATTRNNLSENFPESPVVQKIGRKGGLYCVIKRGLNM